jgi:soluble lytic murein transglycosylase
VARPVPVEEWSLWTVPLVRPDELLLALGLPEQASSAVLRHFPASRPRLGLTGAQLLAGGPATRRAIQIAEVAFGRLPSQVPLDWVDRDWLVLLYPLPWADAVRSQARVRGVDPALLAAVIREESKFDPAAISPASARGLAQFVFPTARRLAEATGLPPITARDLHDPMVAIPLGAAYLAQLSARFQGDELSIAAAYNAGEEQVAAWRRYCYSAQPEELLGKIGFGETRAYATRVLESRAAYQALWMAEP